MRILAMSDIHGRFFEFDPTKLPDADVCIVAGDITDFGLEIPRGYYEYRDVGVKTLAASLEWMWSLVQKYGTVFWTQGNHDRRMPNNFYDVTNAVNIHRRVVEFGGKTFYGESLTTAHARPDLAETWDFTTVSEREDLWAWEGVPETDVVVSHGPPMWTLDTCGPDDAHIGSLGLEAHLQRVAPKLVICGHVHQHGGLGAAHANGITKIVNVAERHRLLELA